MDKGVIICCVCEEYFRVRYIELESMGSYIIVDDS